MLYNVILISDLHAKHPFAGWNTQQLLFLSHGDIDKVKVCKVLSCNLLKVMEITYFCNVNLQGTDNAEKNEKIILFC